MTSRTTQAVKPEARVTSVRTFYARQLCPTTSKRGTFATGGAGSGTPHLHSQGSVVLTRDGRHLLVTNAGSGDVSIFATGEDALTLLHTIPSGGTPRSVTEQGGLVYVLNTEGPALAGFRLQDGGLDPIPNTPRALPDGSDPVQVGIIRDGTGIVVTNRATDSITLYPVDESSRLGEPTEQPSSGPTSYGFAFANDSTLVVTEAFGAQKGKAAASSYVLSSESIRPVSRSVGNGRSEICWGRRDERRTLRVHNQLRRRGGVPLRD